MAVAFVLVPPPNAHYYQHAATNTLYGGGVCLPLLLDIPKHCACHPVKNFSPTPSLTKLRQWHDMEEGGGGRKEGGRGKQ